MTSIDKIFYEGYKHQTNKDYKLAIEVYKRALNLTYIDINKQNILRNLLFELSNCLFLCGDKNQSLKFLLQSFALDKDNPQTRLHLIKHYVLSEELYKAFFHWFYLNKKNNQEELDFIKNLNIEDYSYKENLIGLIRFLLSLKGWHQEELIALRNKESDLIKNLEKPKISVCMIVKNEEYFIRDCLESVKDIAYEIIVVDTGSTDKTKNIASQFAKVYDFDWDEDFSNARNYSISLAKGDWILLMDADEVMPLETSNLLFSFIYQEEKIENNYNIYWFKNLNKTINNKDDFNYYKRTLFKNNIGIKFFRPIHEELFHPTKETFTVYCNKLSLIHRDHERQSEDYLKKNDYYEKILEKTIEKNALDKDNYYYYEYLSNAYKLKGDYKKEGELLNKAFEIYTKNFPDKTDGYYPYLLLLLIKYTALRTDDINKLAHYLDLMLKITQDNPDVIFFVGIYCEKTGYIARAIDSYKEVIRLIDLGDETKFMGLPSMEFKLKEKAIERIDFLQKKAISSN